MLPAFGALTQNAAVLVGGAAAAPFDLDGTPVAGNSVSSDAFALPGLTTSYGNDIIYVAVVTNGGPVTSVTSSGLTWTKREDEDNGGSIVELWSAKSASPLTDHVITVNTTSASFITACAFAFSGANYADPFDGNAAIPIAVPSSTTLTFTTSNADDILIAMRLSGGSAPTPPDNFTHIYGLNFLQVAYRIVTGTQSGAAVSGGDWGDVAAIGDAIKKAA